MMVWEGLGTCFVPFVYGSACMGSKGLVHGMCNHVDSTKHRADMGRLRWEHVVFPVLWMFEGEGHDMTT
jgi:hypothetical protein